MTPWDSNRSPQEAQRHHLPYPFKRKSKVFLDNGRKVVCVRNLHRHERITCLAPLGEAILDNFCDTLPHHPPATCAEHQQSLRSVPGSRQSPDLGSTGGGGGEPVQGEGGVAQKPGTYMGGVNTIFHKTTENPQLIGHCHVGNEIIHFWHSSNLRTGARVFQQS